MGCGASSAHDGGGAGGYEGHGGLRLPLPGSWRAPGPGLSLMDLQTRRATFWETRVSGHPQMWNNLKLVCEALLAGDTELAGTILDSTGMRAQRGDLVMLQAFHVYDATGVLYEMPRLVWSTPANILSNEEAAAAAAAASLQGGSSGGGRRRAVAPGPMAVRVRLAPSAHTCEQDIPMELSTVTSVEELRARLHEALLSGRHDMKPDAAIKRPNVWSSRGGLAPARQRLMYRCGGGRAAAERARGRVARARSLLTPPPSSPTHPAPPPLPAHTRAPRRGKELKEGSLTMADCGIEDGDILQIYIKPD